MFDSNEIFIPPAFERRDLKVTRSIGDARYSLAEWYRLNTANLLPLLSSYTDLNKTLSALPEKREYLVVSLGCGLGEEVMALLNLLGDALFRKIKYIGIDISEYPQLNNLQLNKLYQESGYENVSFHRADATRTAKVISLLEGKKADLIILRHPYLRPTSPGQKPPFAAALTRTIPAISNKDTQLFVTTYSPVEMHRVVFCLRDFINNITGLNLPEGFSVPLIRSKNRTFFDKTPEGEEVYPDHIVFCQASIKLMCAPPEGIGVAPDIADQQPDLAPPPPAREAFSVATACKSFGVFAITAAAVALTATAAYFSMNSNSSN